ncbi:MAG: cytochrome c biogenesis heme-transporting ATPase CcmA [Pseudomonadota bacterium]|nr:cytochrome c biogenesis heme-transporting ATPase CcmA [Pseudomonadota bacterium]
MAASCAVSPAAPPLLEACGLECSRGQRLLFRDLSFGLGPGTACQVQGPNGAGKTSLLRMLCGLSLPDAGEVRWQGREIRTTRAGYLDHMAYVGHSSGVKGELTPLENLALSRALAGTAAAASAQALAQVGLEEFLHHPCRTLSAGQRRRVALARLLVAEARLWIVDEPLTALDAAGVGMVEALLAGHLARGGLAVLTSHQPVALDAPVTLIRLPP